MGPSEANVHCRTGDPTGKVLQTPWSFSPLTVFKSHPRSESSPGPGSAQSTCGEDNKLPRQTNTKFFLKSSQLAKGDCETWPHFPAPSSDQAWDGEPEMGRGSLCL